MQPFKKEDYQSKVEQYYQQLQSELQTLEGSINSVISRHESGFVTAFTMHMRSVQSAMNELQKRTQEAENKLRRDKYISTLEQSLEGFKNEAFRLSQQCQQYKLEAEHSKAEAEAVMKDRCFLEKALKSSMREVKLLKGKCRSQSPIRLPIVAKKQAPSLPETPNGDNFKRVLAHYKHILNLERKDKRRLKTQKLEQWTSRSELEDLFLDCVEAVKRAKKFEAPITVMDHFEKRKLLELFVSNDKVISKVYDLMFPNPSSSSQTSVAFSPRSFSLVGDSSVLLSTARSSASGRRKNTTETKRTIVGGKLLINDKG